VQERDQKLFATFFFLSQVRSSAFILFYFILFYFMELKGRLKRENKEMAKKWSGINPQI
jgi:hypothetical protein